MHRSDPFDAFEVARVAEFPDNHGGTYAERLDGSEPENWQDEAVATFYTVYGHRSWPAHTAPDLEWSDGSTTFRNGIPVSAANAAEYDAWRDGISDEAVAVGATAIADFEDRQEALDLAAALADGKPVYDLT